jgi:hypothetical protein
MITAVIAKTTQPTAARFSSAVACAKYAPIPGSVIVLSPTVIASLATTKNQPPDMLIIMFQTRPGIANGISRRQKRCQAEKRKLWVASSRSRGTVRSDW